MKEITKCDICGGIAFHFIGEKCFKEVRTRSGSCDFIVRLVCCKRCGVIFQNPLQSLEKLGQYYSDMYREEEFRPVSSKNNQFKPRIDAAAKYLEKNQRILEIGCADGSTLALFKQIGMQVFGIEPSTINANMCEKKGIPVFCGVYENYDPELNHKFDLVCNYYLLEHLVSPSEFLSFCNSVLKQGGYLCMELPDIDCYSSEDSPGDLLYFYEHQFHFSKATVKSALEKNGFEIIEFIPHTTHVFGMHLVAKKNKSALPGGHLNVSSDMFNNTMSAVRKAGESHSDQILKIRNKLSEILGPEQTNKKRIVLFGAGDHTKVLLSFPELRSTKIEYLVDNDRNKQDTVFFGYKVQPPEYIDDSIDYIIISSKSFQEEIYEQLIGNGIPFHKIIKLY